MSDDEYHRAPGFEPRRVPPYAENGCARTAGQLIRAVIVPAVLFVLVLIGIVVGNFALAGFVGFFLVLFAGFGLMMLSLSWPLGIRMDAQGIRIGGVAAAEAGRSRVKPRDKPIQGFTRAMHVYSCEWDGVRRLRVITDPRELAAVRANARTGHAKGLESAAAWWANLGFEAWAPGRFLGSRTGALLVFEVEVEHATFQATRAPGKLTDYDVNSGNYAGPGTIYSSPYMTWAIPTRDPRRLYAALAMADPAIPAD